eukprot:SAG31_NODE_502_length_14826_cov_5.474299_7_plen_259_part_00
MELAGSYTQPVVFIGVPSQAGQDHVVVRLSNITYDRCPTPQTWCFSVRLQEPQCLDDQHVPENLNFLVLESGEFASDEGAMFQVGKSVIAGGGFHEVEFRGDGFTTNDVSVLTHVQTTNDPIFVKTRQQPADAYGFGVALEGELPVGDLNDQRNRHGHEAVGWLAIESGLGQLGGLLYESHTTDAEVSHEPFTVHFAASFRARPRFFASMASWNGRDPAAVRHEVCQDESSDVSCHVTRRDAIITVEEESKRLLLIFL